MTRNNRVTLLRVRGLVGCLISLVACGGKDSDTLLVGDDTATTEPTPNDDTAPPGDDTGAPSLEGSCTDDVRWGSFAVESLEDYGYAAGSVLDGVVPTAVLTRVLDDGECTIWKRENPYCDGGCAPSEACGLDGVCVPYPVSQDVGTVTIEGLLQAVSMEPVTPGYTYFDTSLPNPPWTPGATLRLRTGGEIYDPTVLQGVAPTALELASLSWTVSRDRSFPLTWDTPSGASLTEVMVKLSIDQHGITPSKLECRFADDGAGEIPAVALAALMDLGVTGFPEGEIERRTVDRADLGAEGCLEFVSTWSRALDIEIEGYTPCNRDEECPTGLSCNEELQRCE